MKNIIKILTLLALFAITTNVNKLHSQSIPCSPSTNDQTYLVSSGYTLYTSSVPNLYINTWMRIDVNLSALWSRGGQSSVFLDVISGAEFVEPLVTFNTYATDGSNDTYVWYHTKPTLLAYTTPNSSITIRMRVEMRGVGSTSCTNVTETFTITHSELVNIMQSYDVVSLTQIEPLKFRLMDDRNSTVELHSVEGDPITSINWNVPAGFTVIAGGTNLGSITLQNVSAACGTHTISATATRVDGLVTTKSVSFSLPAVPTPTGLNGEIICQGTRLGKVEMNCSPVQNATQYIYTLKSSTGAVLYTVTSLTPYAAYTFPTNTSTTNIRSFSVKAVVGGCTSSESTNFVLTVPNCSSTKK